MALQARLDLQFYLNVEADPISSSYVLCFCFFLVDAVSTLVGPTQVLQKWLQNSFYDYGFDMLHSKYITEAQALVKGRHFPLDACKLKQGRNG